MASSSSYAPNESHSTIIQEEAWLQGALLSNLFFGVQTTLCVLAFLAVLRKRTPGHSRMRIGLLVYMGVLFAVTTAAQGLLLEWIQMAFITQRNYPGGPNAFLNDEWSIPSNLASNILVVCANWMMESLLVWRCHVVCSTGQLCWLGVAISLLLLIVVFVTGSLFILHILHSTPPTLWVLAYGLSSLALNLTATGFIAGRLLVYRHCIVSQLGRTHGQHYMSIVAVVVESAAVYTCFLLVVIVTYALGSPVTNILQQLIEQVQTITSLLVVLQIARGEGWSSSNTEVMSAISSWNTRIGPQAEQNVVQLEVVSMRPDEEEGNAQRKEAGRTVSFPDLKDGGL
ncbi:hypothetical protein J3R83DRAFT_13559 [Lanmaoa asiatica]|nr:hypothetical protein J3R83DRAFT_13559 [Lanmaoa asiatica]